MYFIVRLFYKHKWLGQVSRDLSKCFVVKGYVDLLFTDSFLRTFAPLSSTKHNCDCFQTGFMNTSPVSIWPDEKEMVVSMSG